MKINIQKHTRKKQSLACPHCDEMFDSSTSLNKHIGEQHPDGFESFAQITLDMSTNLEKQLFECKECTKVFYNNSDVDIHTSRVHRYGEYCTMYPCEECGFRGDDVRDIEEHRQNHKDVGTNPTYQRLHKDLEDDSDEDEDLTKSKEREMILQDNSEDEFFFHCNHCSFQTLYEHQLDIHVK
jgi:uncharacterized C2H2 Zn-finger protein